MCVRFSKDPKTSRARKPPRKAPETTFGCFSKHPKTFDPEKYVIFPRKLHGYSLPPEKRFRVCFSCTCLIKWRPHTYFLGQNKWPRSCIKRERVEESRHEALGTSSLIGQLYYFRCSGCSNFIGSWLIGLISKIFLFSERRL